jgi:3-oxoacyl-[acyl-carrier protein] reductase
MATKCLALALAPHIQVNCIAPGIIDPQTGLTEEVGRRLCARTPAGKLGDPDDVAEAVVYLATCRDFITGQIFSIDGGLGLK